MVFGIHCDHSNRHVVILTNADKFNGLMIRDPFVFVDSLNVNITWQGINNYHISIHFFFEMYMEGVVIVRGFFFLITNSSVNLRDIYS